MSKNGQKTAKNEQKWLKTVKNGQKKLKKQLVFCDHSLYRYVSSQFSYNKQA